MRPAGRTCFYRWVFEPFGELKRRHVFMTATELFDGDTGDHPRKDSIPECQRKTMGAASCQTMSGDTPQLGHHELRRVRKDKSPWILEKNEIN